MSGCVTPAIPHLDSPKRRTWKRKAILELLLIGSAARLHKANVPRVGRCANDNPHKKEIVWMLEREEQQRDNMAEPKGCVVSRAVDWKDQDSLGYVSGYFGQLPSAPVV
jgi:hypothetical protein